MPAKKRGISRKRCSTGGESNTPSQRRSKRLRGNEDEKSTSTEASISDVSVQPIDTVETESPPETDDTEPPPAKESISVESEFSVTTNQATPKNTELVVVTSSQSTLPLPGEATANVPQVTKVESQVPEVSPEVSEESEIAVGPVADEEKEPAPEVLLDVSTEVQAVIAVHERKRSSEVSPEVSQDSEITDAPAKNIEDSQASDSSLAFSTEAQNGIGLHEKRQGSEVSPEISQESEITAVHAKTIEESQALDVSLGFSTDSEAPDVIEPHDRKQGSEVSPEVSQESEVAVVPASENEEKPEEQVSDVSPDVSSEAQLAIVSAFNKEIHTSDVSLDASAESQIILVYETKQDSEVSPDLSTESHVSAVLPQDNEENQDSPDTSTESQNTAVVSDDNEMKQAPETHLTISIESQVIQAADDSLGTEPIIENVEITSKDTSEVFSSDFKLPVSTQADQPELESAAPVSDSSDITEQKPASPVGVEAREESGTLPENNQIVKPKSPPTELSVLQFPALEVLSKAYGQPEVDDEESCDIVADSTVPTVQETRSPQDPPIEIEPEDSCDIIADSTVSTARETIFPSDPPLEMAPSVSTAPVGPGHCESAEGSIVDVDSTPTSEVSSSDISVTVPEPPPCLQDPLLSPVDSTAVATKTSADAVVQPKLTATGAPEGVVTPALADDQITVPGSDLGTQLNIEDISIVEPSPPVGTMAPALQSSKVMPKPAQKSVSKPGDDHSDSGIVEINLASDSDDDDETTDQQAQKNAANKANSDPVVFKVPDPIFKAPKPRFKASSQTAQGFLAGSRESGDTNEEVKIPGLSIYDPPSESVVSDSTRPGGEEMGQGKSSGKQQAGVDVEQIMASIDPLFEEAVKQLEKVAQILTTSRSVHKSDLKLRSAAGSGRMRELMMLFDSSNLVDQSPGHQLGPSAPPKRQQQEPKKDTANTSEKATEIGASEKEENVLIVPPPLESPWPFPPKEILRDSVKTNSNLVAIGGWAHPLAINYPFNFKIGDLSFVSLGQAYYYIKCKIMDIPATAAEVKATNLFLLSELWELVPSSDRLGRWGRKVRNNLLNTLIEMKRAQCPAFKKCLESITQTRIVAYDSDREIGTGITLQDALLDPKFRLGSVRGQNFYSTVLSSFLSGKTVSGGLDLEKYTDQKGLGIDLGPSPNRKFLVINRHACEHIRGIFGTEMPDFSSYESNSSFGGVPPDQRYDSKKFIVLNHLKHHFSVKDYSAILLLPGFSDQVGKPDFWSASKSNWPKYHEVVNFFIELNELAPGLPVFLLDWPIPSSGEGEKFDYTSKLVKLAAKSMGNGKVRVLDLFADAGDVGYEGKLTPTGVNKLLVLLSTTIPIMNLDYKYTNKAEVMQYLGNYRPVKKVTYSAEGQGKSGPRKTVEAEVVDMEIEDGDNVATDQSTSTRKRSKRKQGPESEDSSLILSFDPSLPDFILKTNSPEASGPKSATPEGVQIPSMSETPQTESSSADAWAEEYLSHLKESSAPQLSDPFPHVPPRFVSPHPPRHSTSFPGPGLPPQRVLPVPAPIPPQRVPAPIPPRPVPGLTTPRPRPVPPPVRLPPSIPAVLDPLTLGPTVARTAQSQHPPLGTPDLARYEVPISKPSFSAAITTSANEETSMPWSEDDEDLLRKTLEALMEEGWEQKGKGADEDINFSIVEKLVEKFRESSELQPHETSTAPQRDSSPADEWVQEYSSQHDKDPQYDVKILSMAKTPQTESDSADKWAEEYLSQLQKNPLEGQVAKTYPKKVPEPSEPKQYPIQIKLGSSAQAKSTSEGFKASSDVGKKTRDGRNWLQKRLQPEFQENRPIEVGSKNLSILEAAAQIMAKKTKLLGSSATSSNAGSNLLPAPAGRAVLAPVVGGASKPAGSPVGPSRVPQTKLQKQPIVAGTSRQVGNKDVYPTYTKPTVNVPVTQMASMKGKPPAAGPVRATKFSPAAPRITPVSVTQVSQLPVMQRGEPSDPGSQVPQTADFADYAKQAKRDDRVRPTPATDRKPDTSKKRDLAAMLQVQSTVVLPDDDEDSPPLVEPPPKRFEPSPNPERTQKLGRDYLSATAVDSWVDEYMAYYKKKPLEEQLAESSVGKGSELLVKEHSDKIPCFTAASTTGRSMLVDSQSQGKVKSPRRKSRFDSPTRQSSESGTDRGGLHLEHSYRDDSPQDENPRRPGSPDDSPEHSSSSVQPELADLFSQIESYLAESCRSKRAKEGRRSAEGAQKPVSAGTNRMGLETHLESTSWGFAAPKPVSTASPVTTVSSSKASTPAAFVRPTRQPPRPPVIRPAAPPKPVVQPKGTRPPAPSVRTARPVVTTPRVVRPQVPAPAYYGQQAPSYVPVRPPHFHMVPPRPPPPTHFMYPKPGPTYYGEPVAQISQDLVEESIYGEPAPSSTHASFHDAYDDCSVYGQEYSGGVEYYSREYLNVRTQGVAYDDPDSEVPYNGPGDDALQSFEPAETAEHGLEFNYLDPN